MKLIQDDEAVKLTKMIKSGDREMQELAAAILNRKEYFRCNTMTLIFFNFIVTVAHLYIFVYCMYEGAGWYFIPLLIGFVLQVLYSLGYIMHTAKDREKYCEISKIIQDGTD